MSDLIVDFPAQTRCTAVSSKSKKKMVHFSTCISDIRFYERPDKIHKNELHYSREDIREFRMAIRQAVQDMHVMYLLFAKGTTEAAKETFKGFVLTGLEYFLTPGLMMKSMACKIGHRTAVLDEKERQVASGCCDPERLAHAAEEHSRWATQRAFKIGMVHRGAS